MTRSIKRGDIYYVDLSGTIGSEVSKYRPCIVISNDIGNQRGPTVIVLPVTSYKKKLLPTHIVLGKESRVSGVIQTEQVRTVDRSRLSDRIGSVNPVVMGRIESGVLISLGMG